MEGVKPVDKPVRISITNNVALNGGDGAILFGMIKSLKYAFGPDCKIDVFASAPEVSRKLYPEIEFHETLGLAATRGRLSRVRFLGRPWRWLQRNRFYLAARLWRMGFRPLVSVLLPIKHRTSLAIYADSDLIVSSGGTYLRDEYGVESQASDYQITHLLGRPLTFFTQSIGPIERPGTKRLLTPAFERAEKILVRDKRSLQYLQSMEINPQKVQMVYDAAFALANPQGLETAAKKHELKSPLNVAISVRFWPHFKNASADRGMARYRESMAAAVSFLLKLGAEVTFVSTCQGISEYADDSREAREILSLLSEADRAKVKVVSEFIRFDELMQLLSGFDFCIATRLHMCILALMAGVPVLPVAYEFKTSELFESFDLGYWATNIESICPDTFSKKVQAFIDAVPSMRTGLIQNVLHAHRSALGAAKYLFSGPEQTS